MRILLRQNQNSDEKLRQKVLKSPFPTALSSAENPVRLNSAESTRVNPLINQLPFLPNEKSNLSSDFQKTHFFLSLEEAVFDISTWVNYSTN